jgi:flagellar P-ring protein precursor FlgI
MNIKLLHIGNLNALSRSAWAFALFAFCAMAILIYPQRSLGARLKDVATIKGVRENILLGYGIVVGLKGSGDSSTDVTAQSLSRLFGKLGLDLQKDANVKSKNAAAVIVTAKLPPFARVGNPLDVTVSSIGDAASLEGGILLVTPLRAGDQNVYAVAQGAVSLGSVIDGSSKAYPTVGRVVNGATIEKEVDMNFAEKKNFRLSLHHADFTTAARLAAVINQDLGGKFASAKDSATIDVIVPFQYEGNTVELLASIENLQVNIDNKAKVVLNERTGTIVMGEQISIGPIAIAHGDLNIEVKDEGAGKSAKGKGQTNRLIEVKQQNNVSNLVKALNAMGVQPKDLTAIFQTLKQMGALQAELEII